MAVPSHWLGVGRERTTEDDKLPGSDHPQCPYQYNLGRLGYDCEWLMDYEYDYAPVNVLPVPPHRGKGGTLSRVYHGICDIFLPLG